MNGIRVRERAAVPPGKRKAKVRGEDLPRGQDRCRRSATFSFEAVSRERWERAFGPYDPVQFRRALAAQRRQRAKRVHGVAAPYVHDDHLYKGFDYGLGCHVDGRADRNRKMRALGLREVG